MTGYNKIIPDFIILESLLQKKKKKLRLPFKMSSKGRSYLDCLEIP